MAWWFRASDCTARFARGAFDQLVSVVYAELRRLAHRYMQGERAGHLLQTTAFVHEAYFRLVGLDREWEGRRHSSRWPPR